MADSTTWRAIYCPGKAHTEPLLTPNGPVQKSPKILVLCNLAHNEILIQCNDSECRHSGRPKHNGWYKIRLRSDGYEIQAMPSQRFQTLPLSGVVIGED